MTKKEQEIIKADTNKILSTLKAHELAEVQELVKQISCNNKDKLLFYGILKGYSLGY